MTRPAPGARRLPPLVVLVVVACLATGCSWGGADEEADAATTPSSTLALPALPSESQAGPAGTPSEAATVPPPSVDEVGDVHAQLGAVVGLTNPDGSQMVVLSIDSIDVQDSCSAPTATAERGHFLQVRIRVSTGDLQSAGGSWQVSASDFGVKDNGGDAVDFGVSTAAATSCQAASEDPFQVPLDPDSQYVGSIVLDSPYASGTLVFAPPPLQGRSWQWSFG